MCAHPCLCVCLCPNNSISSRDRTAAPDVAQYERTASLIIISSNFVSLLCHFLCVTVSFLSFLGVSSVRQTFFFSILYVKVTFFDFVIQPSSFSFILLLITIDFCLLSVNNSDVNSYCNSPQFCVSVCMYCCTCYILSSKTLILLAK